MRKFSLTGEYMLEFVSGGGNAVAQWQSSYGMDCDCRLRVQSQTFKYGPEQAAHAYVLLSPSSNINVNVSICTVHLWKPLPP